MSPEPGHALVRVAWTPARAEPDHRAEMTDQWLCGESLEVLEETGGWLRCRAEPGHEGWTPRGGALRVSGSGAGEWRSAADGLSLGTGLIPTGGEAGGAGPRTPVPARLPLGARVRVHGDGSVELPTGVRARPLEPAGVVRLDELPSRFRRSGGAVAATARRWLGCPYVWGGRTEWGFDCSGLVQAVFRLHGIRLPRDSAPQRRAGPDVPGLPPPALEAEGSAREVEAPDRGERAGGPRHEPLPFPELLDLLLEGDLLFFAPEGRGITHVAIHTGGGRILHAAASNGCVAEDELEGDGELASRLRTGVVACTRPSGAAPE